MSVDVPGAAKAVPVSVQLLNLRERVGEMIREHARNVAAVGAGGKGHITSEGPCDRCKSIAQLAVSGAESILGREARDKQSRAIAAKKRRRGY